MAIVTEKNGNSENFRLLFCLLFSFSTSQLNIRDQSRENWKSLANTVHINTTHILYTFNLFPTTCFGHIHHTWTKHVVENKRRIYKVCVAWNVFARPEQDVAYKLKISTSDVCSVIHGHFGTTRLRHTYLPCLRES